LRPEEQRLLAEAGRFRVLQVKDIAQSIYKGDERALRTDLDYLEKHGLVSLDSVAPRNDGRWLTKPRIEVVTLTKAGERLAHETSGFAPNQKLYHGLVKPREVEHDSQIYRAYLKEAERIEKAGGTNLRVELDFELKSKVQKAIHAAQKADPGRDMGEIKREVAEQHDLPFVRNKIEIPDARIHYDMDQGSHTAFSDVEVVTAAYRPGHMRAKSQAGFRMYASPTDRSRLATVEDEQHLLDWVMDL
jgi:DNA-binding transcriptional ArsR family regulator